MEICLIHLECAIVEGVYGSRRRGMGLPSVSVLSLAYNLTWSTYNCEAECISCSVDVEGRKGLIHGI
jgi:hypothetical protein